MGAVLDKIARAIQDSKYPTGRVIARVKDKPTAVDYRYATAALETVKDVFLEELARQETVKTPEADIRVATIKRLVKKLETGGAVCEG